MPQGSQKRQKVYVETDEVLQCPSFGLEELLMKWN